MELLKAENKNRHTVDRHDDLMAWSTYCICSALGAENPPQFYMINREPVKPKIVKEMTPDESLKEIMKKIGAYQKIYKGSTYKIIKKGEK